MTERTQYALDAFAKVTSEAICNIIKGVGDGDDIKSIQSAEKELREALYNEPSDGN